MGWDPSAPSHALGVAQGPPRTKPPSVPSTARSATSASTPSSSSSRYDPLPPPSAPIPDSFRTFPNSFMLPRPQRPSPKRCEMVNGSIASLRPF